MFKKFLFSVLSVALILGMYKAYALLGKEGQIPSDYQPSVSYINLYVVSENDFKDTISIRATSTPGTNLSIQGSFNGGSFVSQYITPNTVTVDNTTNVYATATYKWSTTTLYQVYPNFVTYSASFKATDQNTGAESNLGNYSATVNYAIISLTNNQGLQNGGSTSTSANLSFTCTNSTYMAYYPNADTSSNSNVGNQNGYTWTYNAPSTVGKHKIECGNIGGQNTIKSFVYTVTEPSCPTPGHIKDSTGYCHAPCSTGYTWNESSKQCVQDACPTGQTRSDSPSGTCHVPCTAGQTWNDTTKQCVTTSCGAGQELIGGTCRDVFDIINISSSPNQAGAEATFSWTSTADTCNVYTNDKTTRLNPGASSKSGNNFSATVPVQNMSNAPGSYLYYIKCYSSTKSPSTNIEADTSDPTHTGWKSYTTTLSCPTGQTWDNVNKTCKSNDNGNCPQGQVKDSTGYCHTPCEPYQDWYEGGRYCNNICNPAMIYDKSTNTCSCPTGTTWNGSTCATSILTFNIASISSTPNQSSTQNTFTWISEADTCNVYTNDKATRLNPSASSKSGNSFSAIVPSQNMPSGQGSYLYYIKCYSSTKSPSTNIEADTSDPTHTGWKSYTVSISCPTGQIASAGESCHAPCSSGQIWDEGSKSCKINDSSRFNILNIQTSPNEINKTITFSWWSDAGENYCHIYNYDKSATIGYALKQSSQNWTTNVSSDKLPSAPGVYGYYIRCSDRNKHADSSLEETTDGTYYFGWKNFNLTLTCPNGQSYNAYYDRCEPDSCPAGQELVGGSCQPIIQYFNISSINVSPKETGKNNTFTWYSEADTCNVYSYEFQYGSFTGVRLNPSASTKSGNNFSAIVPSQNMPSSAGNYGYYIKCQSTDASRESVESLRPTWDNDIYTGWKYYTVTLTTSMPACPDGQVRSSPTGVCHSPCPSGYTWNEAAGTCGNPNPICNWADPATKMSVTCSVPYVCENGNPPELRVYYKDGHYDVINPATNPFTWDTNQYQYQFYCSPTVLTPIAPLRKTYTHFLTFNVSASNVQKGTKVNLNWSVEDPNITCKIEGVSIKNPTQVVFNSKALSQLDAKISTSTGSVQTTMKNLATGDYNTIMGQYWTVNQSTRFTASCTDTGTYKPGYYQLVRDIYVTGEEER